MQDSLLKRNDAILVSALSRCLDRPKPLPADYAAQLPQEIRDFLGGGEDIDRGLLLSNPLTVELPPLPQAIGASADFTRQVRERLQSYRKRWRLFSPLVVPIKVTFLVVPPAQGKDLDNIALTVLPIVRDVLKPHVEPHLLAPEHPDEPDPDREKALARLRSLNAESVSAYQVIELPRAPQDPPEGVLRLALGAHSIWSWWDHVAQFLNDRAEQFES
jgi:hypothetical protein